MIGLGNKMTTGGKLVISVPDQNNIATVSVVTVADPGETTFTLDGSYVSAIAVTAVGFQYSVNSDMSSPTTVNATLANPFTADVTGLTAATTYYYRAFATNEDGTAYSETKSLTTDAEAQETPAATGPGSGAPDTPSGYTLLYSSDFSSDTDGWGSSASVAQVTGDVDTVSDDNGLVLNNVLEVQRTASHNIGAFWANKNIALLDGVSNLQGNGKTYIAVADVLVPSSNNVISIDAIRFGSNVDNAPQGLTEGEWYRATTEAKEFTISSSIYVYGSSPGADTDDKFYVGNLWLYESN